ncbi:MAG: hypothetical protein E7082_05790 [Bacteroidales bacterium]|nr:hypothetical protein [Bacteroidales bacterium]
MSKLTGIKGAAVISYFTILVSIITSLVYTPWMIEQIGQADYGLYVLVTSFLAYFTADYGLWQAINKLVAEHHTNGNYKQEHHIVNVASSIYLLIDCFIAVVLTIIYFNIESIFSNLTPEELSTFKILFLIAAVFAVLSFPMMFLPGVMKGREFFVQSNTFDLLNKLGIVAITIILLLCNGGVVSLVIAFGAVPMIIRFSEYIFISKKCYIIHPIKIDKTTAKAIFGLSLWLFLVVFGELFITNISPSVLAKCSNTTQIAIFGVGLTLYGLVAAFARAVNGLFLPKIYRLQKSDSKDEIERLSSIVSSLQIFIVGFFVMAIVCVGQPFIYLWVGDSFASSYQVTLWLLVPVMITFCQPIENSELFARNKLYWQSIVKVSTAASSIVCSIILCPKYGAVGAAISIGLSTLLFSGIILNIIYYYVLKRSRINFVKQAIKYVGMFAILYLIYGWLNSLLDYSTTTISNFIIRAMIFVILYLIVIYPFALSRNAKKIIVPKFINLKK